MASITYPTKSTNDTFSATEANEIKTVVNGKADSDHSHIISNTTGLQDALDAKLATSGLLTALDSATGQDTNAVLDTAKILEDDIATITAGHFLTKAVDGGLDGVGTATISGEDLLNLTSLLEHYDRATTSGPAAIALLEDADTGTSKVTLTVPSALSANRTFTFPDADVTATYLGAASDVWAGTSTAVHMTPAIWTAAMAPTAVADAATITINLNAGINFEVSALGGNRTLAFSNYSGKGGRSGWIRIVQDATGSRTLTPSTDVEPTGAGTISINSTASQVSILGYAVTSGNKIMIGGGS